MTELIVVIMCGGNGSRLWPLSRKALPKQFLKLTDNERTMFQLSCLRVKSLKYSKLVIICNQEHFFLAEQQLLELNIKNYQIIGEPEGRNTAPVIAIASQICPDNSNILVISADHVFNDSLFCETVYKGLRAVSQGIVTFGVRPTYPSTGFGYMNYSKSNSNDDIFDLINFIEKPQKEKAQEYLDEENYLWNSGNFLFSNKIMRQEFEKLCPKLWCEVSEVVQKCTSLDSKYIKLDKEKFSKLNPEDLSIDYAIMEKHTCGKVVIYDGLWRDIGSFDSLHEYKVSKLCGNVHKGSVYSDNCRDCFVQTYNDKIVATIGLNNLVIVDTEDALLVSNKSNSQDIKKIVSQLKKDKKEQILFHTKVYRPWGYYININGNDNSGSKVKRIVVYPGKRLSLQSHNKRSEHWVITKGHARVQVGEKFYDLTVNEHIFIPVTEKHRMENTTSELVEFVETQIGTYLGEDDIIRYQDDFGRV